MWGAAPRRTTESYIGARGLPPEFIAQLEREFGFDKPPVERFLFMMWNYMRFDFGDQLFPVDLGLDLVIEKMPVSISLGPVVHADCLCHLHPAGHSQGGARWHAL
jgi:microcin C transport system permease protein